MARKALLSKEVDRIMCRMEEIGDKFRLKNNEEFDAIMYRLETMKIDAIISEEMGTSYNDVDTPEMVDFFKPEGTI